MTRTFEAPMTVSGIDRSVAARAGNTVAVENGVTVLRDGRSGAELARVGGNAGRTLQPSNTVRGNCGSSYITITWLGKNRYNVWTGFRLNRPGVAWTWAYTVFAEDDRGVYHDSWDDHGGLDFERNWSHVRSDMTDLRGATHVARVSRGIAITVTGAVCSTGYPTDAAYIPR